MATITNSIFINDEDGDLEITLEGLDTDAGLRRLSISDGYTGTGINILGTIDALQKLKRVLVDGLKSQTAREQYWVVADDELSCWNADHRRTCNGCHDDCLNQDEGNR